MFLSFLIAPILSLATISRAQNALFLDPPLKPGLDPSKPLYASFAGFGIEPPNLFSFTGGDQINKFSLRLLQNLADYAGSPVPIRLGGNTQDIKRSKRSI